jgi:hypothetical protein
MSFSRTVSALAVGPPRLASRAAGLPAIAVALLPKCPMCVMVILGALGVGHTAHEAVFALLQGATLAMVVGLLALRHRGEPLRIVLAAEGAFAVGLSSAGLMPAVAGYAGALLLAWTWLAAPRGKAVPACGCAASGARVPS